MRRFMCVVVLLLAAVPASAQEKGDAGLAVSTNAIGFVWHMSDSFALRPDFSFSRTSSDRDQPSGGESSSWTLNFAVSGVFYTGKIRDNVRTYVSPRFTYTRGQGSSETTSETGSSSSESRLNGYQYAGSFGAEYAVSRFGVYGEVGITYAHGDSRSTAHYSGSQYISDTVASKSTSTGFGTRAAVGVVLYFK